MTIYQRSEQPRQDAEFEPGTLAHVVVGKVGRLLDARRTPVQIVSIDPATGTFSTRIEAFEDRGAIWETELENVGHYQFEPGAPLASDADVARFEEAIATFDRKQTIPSDAAASSATNAKIDAARERARPWLAQNAPCFKTKQDLPDPEQRVGIAQLWSDLESYMESLQLLDIEAAFARQFVSNPYSGDLVKGHRMVMAEMGLASYEGKIVRHPDTFTGRWSKERRAAHIVARIAFVREFFAWIGYSDLKLYRGLSTDKVLQRPRGITLVSTTTSYEVAMSHFESLEQAKNRVLYAQATPVERIFMTYFETRAMNDQFKEAEVVLFSDELNQAF